MKRIQLIIIAIAVVLGTQACKKDENNDVPEVAVKIGSTAPNFEIADENGTLHKLYDYRGEYVVVDFWAAWCGICRTENPKMQNLYTNYQNKNVEVIGVCLDANTDNWKNVVSEDQLTYIQLIDNEAFSSKVASTYGITSVPFMMLLDPDGIILTITSKVSDIEAKLQQVVD